MKGTDRVILSGAEGMKRSWRNCRQSKETLLGLCFAQFINISNAKSYHQAERIIHVYWQHNFPEELQLDSSQSYI